MKSRKPPPRRYGFTQLMARLTSPAWSVIAIDGQYHFVESAFLKYTRRFRNG